MKINKIHILFIFIFLYSCAGYEKNKSAKDDNKIYYSSSGFALIYEDKTINKKINNELILILHSTLKNILPCELLI